MPELDRRHKMAILVICCMGLFIVGLDNTIVNLALPSIGHELQASVSSLQWVIDAYTVVLASLLMLAGSVGDRIGRKRVFQTGLVLFGLGSLLCSIAPSIGLLIVFRMLQAVGGSMLNPVAMSIITNTFTRTRGAGQGHRGLGFRGGAELGARAGSRRRAGGRCRLAVGVLDQRADRVGRRGARGAVRAGVPRGPSAAARPDRTAAGDRTARHG